ncbi:MAG TPA: secretin N-terminal domain-containing protein [Gammaproteobacteria bacterium]|nr:secretin N-terminal domain-containing protein [Gammaproteobacteria bacterium]
MNYLHLCICTLTLFVSGCVDYSSVNDTLIDIKTSLNSAVDKNTSLADNKQTVSTKVPSNVDDLLIKTNPNKNKKKFSFSIKEMPAKVFFSGLATGTKTNIIVDPSIDDQISLNLKYVTLDNVFETLHGLYGYHITGNNVGYKVSPKQLETRVFLVNRMNIERTGSSSMSVSSSDLAQKEIGGESTTSSKKTSSASSSTVSTTYNDSSFWNKLQSTIEQMIGLHLDRTTSSSSKSSKKTKSSKSKKKKISDETTPSSKKIVSIDPNLGTVVVTAYPDELNTIQEYIKTLQRLSDKQVIIEAKILDVGLNKHHREGLDLNLPKTFFKPNMFNNGTSDETPTLGYSVASTTTDFSIALNFISKQGDITILSSPRVSTMNNQKAVIKIGSDKYFATTSSKTTSRSSSSSTVDSVDVTPIFSGVALDVTPEISADNSVTLHIHPYISEVTSETFATNNSEGKSIILRLPKVTVTESDTVVRAKDGEVIVIGGLMKQMSEDHDTRIPGFRNFNPNRENKMDKREMVILLKPTVVKNKTWSKAMTEFNSRIR